MRGLPVKLVYGEGYVPVENPEEATHLTINIPGPTGRLTLPIILRGSRKGTGCWTWNGNTNAPTLKPSVSHTTGHFIKGNLGECWCDYNRENPSDLKHFICFNCHTWISDGKATFLDDCSHELKGQTVDLLDAE